MRDFKKLTVWQKAHELAVAVYKIRSNFPKDKTPSSIFCLVKSGTSSPISIGLLISLAITSSAKGSGVESDSESIKAKEKIKIAKKNKINKNLNFI